MGCGNSKTIKLNDYQYENINLDQTHIQPTKQKRNIIMPTKLKAVNTNRMLPGNPGEASPCKSILSVGKFERNVHFKYSMQEHLQFAKGDVIQLEKLAHNPSNGHSGSKKSKIKGFKEDEKLEGANTGRKISKKNLVVKKKKKIKVSGLARAKKKKRTFEEMASTKEQTKPTTGESGHKGSSPDQEDVFLEDMLDLFLKP
jgi:hypothetical protein